MFFPFDLRTDTAFDVVGFGTNAVDHLIRVSEFPAFGSKTQLTGYVLAAGGEVATTLVGLQRLGAKTAYAGRFGGDGAGEIGLRSLIEAGVNTHFVETIADAPTQLGFIIIDDISGERTVIWHRDDRLKYCASDAPLEAAVSGKILHLTPHDTDACIEMARTAKQAGMVTSIDIDKYFDGVDELLPLIDICIASTDLTKSLFGTSDTKDALRNITLQFGCAVAGVTLGIDGSVILCGETIVETHSFAVPGGCIDTTGAGDAFRTGLLHGVLHGATVETSARLANAAAALKCRGVGARTSLPTINELKNLVEISGH